MWRAVIFGRPYGLLLTKILGWSQRSTNYYVFRQITLCIGGSDQHVTGVFVHWLFRFSFMMWQW